MALASAFRSEFQGKGTGSSTDRKPLQNKNKKEKKEAKEETEDEKAQKSLKACLSAMNRHQEKLMVAISKLEKDRAAAGIQPTLRQRFAEGEEAAVQSSSLDCRLQPESSCEGHRECHQGFR